MVVCGDMLLVPADLLGTAAQHGKVLHSNLGELCSLGQGINSGKVSENVYEFLSSPPEMRDAGLADYVKCLMNSAKFRPKQRITTNKFYNGCLELTLSYIFLKVE